MFLSFCVLEKESFEQQASDSVDGQRSIIERATGMNLHELLKGASPEMNLDHPKWDISAARIHYFATSGFTAE